MTEVERGQLPNPASAVGAQIGAELELGPAGVLEAGAERRADVVDDQAAAGLGGLVVRVFEERGRAQGQLEVVVDQRHASREAGPAADGRIVEVVVREAARQAHPLDVEVDRVEPRADQLGVAQVEPGADVGPIAEGLEGLARVEPAVFLLQAEIAEAFDGDGELGRGQLDRLEGPEQRRPLLGLGVPALAQEHAQGRPSLARAGERRERVAGWIDDQLEAQARAILVERSWSATERPVVVTWLAARQRGAGQGQLDPALGRADLDHPSRGQARAQVLVVELGGRDAELAEEGLALEARVDEPERQRDRAGALAERERRRAEAKAEQGRGRMLLVGQRRAAEGLPARRGPGVVELAGRVGVGVEVAPLDLARDRIGQALDVALGQLEHPIDVGPGVELADVGIAELIAEAIEHAQLTGVEVLLELDSRGRPRERLIGQLGRPREHVGDDPIEADQAVSLGPDPGQDRASSRVELLAVGVGEDPVDLAPVEVVGLARFTELLGEADQTIEALDRHREVDLERADLGLVLRDRAGRPRPDDRRLTLERLGQVGRERGRVARGQVPGQHAPLPPTRALEQAVDLGPLGVDPQLDPHQRFEGFEADRSEVLVDVLADRGLVAVLEEVVDVVDLREPVGLEVEHPDPGGEVGVEVTRVGRVHDPEQRVDPRPLGVGLLAPMDPLHHRAQLVVLEEELLIDPGDVERSAEPDDEGQIDRSALPARDRIAGLGLAERELERVLEGRARGQAAIAADIGDARDSAIDEDRAQLADHGLVDEQLALGPIDPSEASAVAAGLQRSPGRQAQLCDPVGEADHDRRAIGLGRGQLHAQDLAIVVVEVATGQLPELLAGVAEQLDEGQEQREVGPAQPARLLALEALGLGDVGDDVGDRQVGVVGEGPPVTELAQRVGVGVGGVVAQPLDEGLHEREQVGAAALVDARVAGIEGRQRARALAGPVVAGRPQDDRTPGQVSSRETWCWW